MVLLLAAVIFINYFDRGNLATVSPSLKDELRLSNSQLGMLFSAFFWSYAPMQPLAGWVAQRFDVRLVLAGGLALWALATIASGLASGFAMLLVLRVLLGIGESVAYPSNSRLLAQCVAAHERGRANGLVAVGQALGPTCGTVAGGFLLLHNGWRASFIVFGALSLLWLLPWYHVTAGPAAALIQPTQPVGYRVLLTQRALWGTGIGHFCGNYAYYFMLSWLPLLLVRSFSFSVGAMTLIVSCVYAVHALSATVTGWLCDRGIRAGLSPQRVWKPVIIAGMVGVAIPMALAAHAGAALLIGLLMIAGVCFGLQSPSLGAITQTLAGPRAAGQWMGIQNLVANMAGVLAPLVTGIVVDRTGEFFWAFAIAALVTLAGAFAFGLLIRCVEPVSWPAESS
jgi:MFS family permease